MNQTIYFRKDVWNKLQDEKYKSNLINQLLSEHYGLDPKEVSVSDDPIPKEFIAPKKTKLCKVHNIEPEYCGNMKH